jgi:hypothetical protein
MPVNRLTQKLLFPDDQSPMIRDQTSSTFVDNMKLPVHRWYRFSAGFSAQWVESVIAEAQRSGPVSLLDPFAGAGTTLIAAEMMGAECFGIEAHPFIARAARAKLQYRTDPTTFIGRAREIKRCASTLRGSVDGYPALIHKCFTSESLTDLDRLRQAWEKLDDGSPASELAWLTLIAILRPVSHAGTAPWQYVLPRKTKKAPLGAMAAFDQMARTVAADMQAVRPVTERRATLVGSDARTCDGVPDDYASLVITSPPYANNYDYADATRLEMCFLREIKGWGDLQTSVRRLLVRSCTQHVPESAVKLESVLASPELAPVRSEITEVCRRLARIRHAKGGKKNYHLMIACYFQDLAQVWRSLRRACRRPSRVCFVIGDSAPYGVYVPVVEWMGALSKEAGFSSFEFEKTRDRNVKWKNRKHRVPLCEGRLWVRG